MIDFNYFIPTRVVFGKNAVEKNTNLFKEYGKRVLIVTGKTSGDKSGALKDVKCALENSQIEYRIFNEVLNNPTLENVKLGGDTARDYKPDFIIGVGGGSPLDASKAIATLAVNDIEPMDLYQNSFINHPLPIIAIPTTAGTGSEVTPYSILTRNDIKTKMGFGNDYTFPKVAIVDPKYTYSLSSEITIHTAIDAFSHALEGYLAKRATPISDIFAKESIDLFGQVLPKLSQGSYSIEDREKLMRASVLAGIVISHTRTTFVHGMGYSLTYFKGIPHGAANGVFISEYLRFVSDVAKDRVKIILNLLKFESVEDLEKNLKNLLKLKIEANQSEIAEFAKITMGSSGIVNNLKDVRAKDVEEIIRKSLKLA